MQAQCRRFIGSQIVEDGFNKCKHKVDQQKNTLTCARTMHATVIDSQVISNTHGFQEVDRPTALVERSAKLPPSANKPVLIKKRLDSQTRELGIHTVAGYGEAEWHSPGAAGYTQPMSDLIVLRQAKSENRLAMIEK